MKNLNCKNCGGVMVIDPSARTAVCHYCHTVYVLNHEDTDYYHDFYAQMNRFLTGSEDEIERRKRAEKLWEEAYKKTFECTDERHIEVRYMYSSSEEAAMKYVARSSIIFNVYSEHKYALANFRNMVSVIDYPSADIRNLSDFFPNITGGFEVNDGSALLVISKDEDEYPLCLFGILPARHVAWLVSRLENICCVLEYSGIVHPHIDTDNIYINPYTHQACLYGGWSDAVKNNSYTRNRTKIARTKDNLLQIRDTAAHLLGFDSAKAVTESEELPKAFAEFIRSDPKEDAYSDFAYWDESLKGAYGERKFIRMDTEDKSLYKNTGSDE